MYFWVISCSSASFLCCFSFTPFKYFSFLSSWHCVLLSFLFLPPYYLSFLHSFLLMTSRRHASLLSLNQTCNSLQTWLWDAGCSGFLRCSERRWVGRNGHQHPPPPPRTHTYTHTHRHTQGVYLQRVDGRRCGSAQVGVYPELWAPWRKVWLPLRK